MNKKQHINLSKAPAEGFVFVDVASGVAGPALYVGDNDTGHRISGPKPLGGGTTIYRFSVKISDLRECLETYENVQKKTSR